MRKISEAGALYLKDYQVLTEARREVEKYLNSIVDVVYKIISDEKNSFSFKDFKINLWQNQSSKGHLEVQFINLEDTNLLRKDKIDIYIIYKDIRNADDIDTSSGKVFVWSPNLALKLENYLRELSIEKFGEDIYTPTIIEFDLNDSIETAETISKEVLNKAKLINKLIADD